MRIPIQDVIQSYEALIQGLRTNCPDQTFILRGKTYDATEAVALLTSLLNAAVAERNAKTDWQGAMAARKRIEATDGAVARELRQIVAVSYSSQHTLLGTFGLTAKKERVPLTTAARLAATAKLQATRKARGTTSRKQKLAITGNVVGVTVTPVTAAMTGPGETSEAELGSRDERASAASEGSGGDGGP